MRTLAKRMDYPRSTIADKLNGTSHPTWEFVEAFLEACAHPQPVSQDKLNAWKRNELLTWREAHQRLLEELRKARAGGRRATAAAQTLAGSVSWPVRVGSMPPAAKAFQPRTAARARVAAAWGESLTASGPVPGVVGEAVDGSPGLGSVVALVQTVVGDGGVGKTQLAASIAREASASGTDVVVWVPAGSRDQIVGVYAEAGRRVQAPGWESPDVDVAARGFLDWAATTTRSWLVVLDDLTASAAEVRGLWPDTGTGTGRVLVTTRQRSATLPAVCVDLGVFTPEESHAYLHQRVADYPGPVAAGVLDAGKDLAEKDLGHLPVALAQAIAVILDQGITAATYRDWFADKSRTLATLFPGEAAADEYTRTVATTWSLAIEQAVKISPLAQPVAELIALLDPAGAPEAVLTCLAARAYLAASSPVAAPGDGGEPADVRRPLLDPLRLLRALGVFTQQTGRQNQEVSPEQARAGLRALYQLSVISHDPDGGPVAIRVHALAQRAITDHMDPDRLTTAVRAMADTLMQAWPDPERDPALSAVLRANTTHLHTMHPDPLWDPGPAGAHPVLFRAVSSLGHTGQVTAAAHAAAALHTHAARELGPDHPDTLTTRHDIAHWHGEAGDAAGAAAALQELLTDQIRVLGANHRHTLTTRNNLADRRGAAGDAAGAAAALQELLTDLLRVLGPDHPDTLGTRSGLAYWHGEAGDPARAAAALQELLTDQIRMLGPHHPDTLTTRNNLATCRGEAGDPAGAAADLQELLTDRIRMLGPDHPDTLATRNNLATCRGEAGDPAGAAADFQELLTDLLRVLGPDHPGTLATRKNLATCRGEAGDPAGAAADLQELLTDRIRVLGPHHPDTLATRINLAYWRRQAGDTEPPE